MEKGYWVILYAGKPFVSDGIVWFSEKMQDLIHPELLAKLTGLKQDAFSQRYYDKDAFYETFQEYLCLPED